MSRHDDPAPGADEAFEVTPGNDAAGASPHDVLDELPSRAPDEPADDLPPPKEEYEEAVDDLDGGNVMAIDRVVRLNRRTIGVGLITLAGICALVLIWASTPSPPTTEDTVSGTESGPGQQTAPVRALALNELPETYADLPEPPPPPPAVVAAPAGDLEDSLGPAAPMVLSSSRFPPREMARGATGASRPAPLSEAERSEKERLELMVENAQLRQERLIEAQARANRSPILASGLTGGGVDAAAAATSAFDDGLRPPVAPVGFGNLGLPEGVRSNLQGEKQAFAAGSGDTTAVLERRLVAPVSPYLLQAGHTIAATLITEINTDLPGRIIAQVTENAYDSVTGQHLLIPQGSRLLGSYDSLVSNGQDRALMRWERLLLPNGRSMQLDGMLGVDPTGAAGVKDRVDYHLDRLLGAILLSTAITFTANTARNDTDGLDGFQSNRDLAADSIAERSADVGNRIVDRQLDIQPTIKIRQGARVRVLVEADLVLEPYRYRR